MLAELYFALVFCLFFGAACSGAMSTDGAPKIVVNTISGEILWTGQVDEKFTARELSHLISRETGKIGKILMLHQDNAMIGFCSKLPNIPARSEGLHLSGTWLEAKWPVPAHLAQLWVERDIEPFLERPPPWRQLLHNSQAMRGFVRGVFKKIDEDIGKLAAGNSSEIKGPEVLMEMLGLPTETLRELPSEQQQQLQSLWSLADRTEDEDSLQELVRRICQSISSQPGTGLGIGRMAQGSSMPRLIAQWPTKTKAKRAMAMLIATRLHEICGEDLIFKACQVDAAVASMFVVKPDLPLIRRSLMEMKILDQPSFLTGSTSELRLNFSAGKAYWEEFFEGSVKNA